MDRSALGIVTVAAITVICYLVGLVVKATPLQQRQVHPQRLRPYRGDSGRCGAVHRPAGLLPAADPLTAVAVGIVSGLAASGSMKGGADGALMLSQPVTQQQFVDMLYNFAKLAGKA